MPKELANQLVDKSIPPGKWWRIAKSVTRLKKQNPSPPLIVCQDDRILVHHIDKANEFNSFFSSISSLNDVPKLPEHGPEPPDLEFNDIIITEQDVIDQLKYLL